MVEIDWLYELIVGCCELDRALRTGLIVSREEGQKSVAFADVLSTVCCLVISVFATFGNPTCYFSTWLSG